MSTTEQPMTPGFEVDPAAFRHLADAQVNVELDTVTSEFRDLTEPILNRINELDAEYRDDLITVIIPEFVTSIKSQWLHNQSALAIKAKLLFRPNTVVTSVPIVIP